MDTQFLLFSDSNLTQLLSSYQNWLDNQTDDNDLGYSHINSVKEIVDKIWDVDIVKNLSDEDYYNLIRNYLTTIPGVFPAIGEQAILATRERITENLGYIKGYDGDPFVLSKEILYGDKQIKNFSRSFWCPFLQKKFPEVLPYWNGRTDRCLKILGVNIDRNDDLRGYRDVCNAFSHLHLLNDDLDFPELDHFMHYCVAIDEGIQKVKELSEISLILSKFLLQANTQDLTTSSYPKKFRKFFMSISFGQGNQAKIPWIGFDIYERDESKGIFINYLYFKDINKIALVFGVKEENEPDYFWPDNISENYRTVDEEIPTAARYKDSYVYKIYDVKGEKIQEEKDVIEEDLNKILKLYNEAIEATPNDVRYWIIAAGPDGSMWETFKEENVIAIDYSSYNLGDLNNYSARESLEEKMRGDEEGSKKNDILAVWEFSKVMKPGDIVIAKKGGQTLLGYGKVSSDYIYDSEKEEYSHIREITWEKFNAIDYTGNIEHLVYKTLTDLTQYPGYPEKLVRVINGEEPPEGDENYWWMYCNPEVWDPTTDPIGFEQTYTAINERGNKRRIFKNFKDAKKGDRILGYVSTPIKQITSIFELTKPLEELGGKEIGFKIVEHLKNPIDWEDLKSLPELQNSEPFKNSQGSFYKLTQEEFDIILSLSEPTGSNGVEEWTRDDTMRDLFIEEDELEGILESIKYKNNIILQGPPGVGKTFYAKRIAYDLFGKKDPNRIAVVQFHQSYSYEDFIQGYRPTEDGNFILRKGLFYDFCIKAQRDKENDYVFIIDEINRGNLSKIFGELMMLIENDKRGPEHGIKLPYQKESDLSFYIPENLYLIGTMNTADRSLAMVDYALRRRFRFITLNPEFNDKFSDYLLDNGVTQNIVDKILNKIVNLNEEISKESNLGKGFTIGHSYFTPTEQVEDSEEWYKTIIDNEIAPLLHEYYFDDEKKAEDLIAELY
jgi:5-methylcytosine-specific restriction protein B